MFDPDLIAIEWKCYINGIILDDDRKLCITSFDIQELDDGSDTLTLVVNDPEFLYIEDNIYIEEAKIKFEMNLYEDTNKVEFNGYISAIDINFPDTGLPEITLTCLDNSHLMNRDKKSRSWDNTTSANVVRAIAKEYGFSCEIESGYSFTQEDTITQSNQTDIEFIEQLASNERDMFMGKLVGNTIIYKKKGLITNPSLTLSYKAYPYNIISFSPQINKETKQIEVIKSDISSNTKKTETSKASNTTTNRDIQGQAVKTSSSPVSNSGSSNSSKNYTYNPKTGKWEVS